MLVLDCCDLEVILHKPLILIGYKTDPHLYVGKWNGAMESVWRIKQGENEAELSWQEIVGGLLRGNISYSSMVYDEKSKEWLPLASKSEFAVAFPIIPLFKLNAVEFVNLMKANPNGVTGIITVASDWKEVIPIAKLFRAEGLPKGAAFFIQEVNPNVKKRITRPVRMFEVFNDFLVSSFVEDKKVFPSAETLLFVLGMNVGSHHASHSLIPYEFPISEIEKSKLNFDLPPKCWALRVLKIDTRSRSGTCRIEFRTTSRAERAAKAGIAAALTLGVLRYDAGYKGFSIQFDVVPPNTQKTSLDHMDKGELLFQINDYEAAVDEFQSVLALEPNNQKAHKILGVIYNSLDMNDKAEQELREATRIDNKDEAAHVNLGIVLEKLKRDVDAEKEMKEAIRIKPNDLFSHYTLASFYGKKGSVNEAKLEYVEMLNLDPKCGPAYKGLFTLLMNLNETEKKALRNVYLEVESIFAKAVLRLPNEANLHSYLGYVQMSLRKFTEAEREFNIALRIDSRNQIAQTFLGLKQKGEWEKIGVSE